MPIIHLPSPGGSNQDCTHSKAVIQDFVQIAVVNCLSRSLQVYNTNRILEDMPCALVTGVSSQKGVK